METTRSHRCHWTHQQLLAGEFPSVVTETTHILPGFKEDYLNTVNFLNELKDVIKTAKKDSDL